VLSLFPKLLAPWLEETLLAKAIAAGHLTVQLVDLRDFAAGRHHKVDAPPYGGGAGMVIRADVVLAALGSVAAPGLRIGLSPAGRPLRHPLVEQLAQSEHLILLAGRYEGFDARVESKMDLQVSIGDFVLMGGEAAALCLIEAVVRLRPGVLGSDVSFRQDSFYAGLLDYPEYTLPPSVDGQVVPEVLRGGNHQLVARWRRRQSLRRTWLIRPDLLPAADLTGEDLEDLLALGVSPGQLAEWGFPVPKARPAKRRRT
jgi:tRNA (guanine37-N1)-methyltransferase